MNPLRPLHLSRNPLYQRYPQGYLITVGLGPNGLESGSPRDPLFFVT